MIPEPNPETFNADAVVIGGSYAGLSAALQLARARRRVVVVDAGAPRNRMAAASHGLLGRDGASPAAIAAEGRSQLLAYPTVTWVDGAVTAATARDGGFGITIGDDRHLTTRRVVIATGVTDTLPDIPGLAERWGRSVFHCPYCHGYELNEGRIGVLATGPTSLHHATMLPDWGRVTLFTNAALELDIDQRAALTRRGVGIEPTPVAALADEATVVLRDGRRLVMDGLFTMSHTRPASDAAEQLGCAFDSGPMGPFVRTDPLKATTVPGVFACGDVARGAGSVALAVGDGTQAGIATHQSLLLPPPGL